MHMAWREAHGGAFGSGHSTAPLQQKTALSPSLSTLICSGHLALCRGVAALRFSAPFQERRIYLKPLVARGRSRPPKHVALPVRPCRCAGPGSWASGRWASARVRGLLS